MRVTFIGAAHEVTGSCTLLELNGRYYLIDCGMEQGVNTFENVPLPVAPGQIEAVFVTHAHVDHSGMLPRLYKNGFQGKIYATAVTERLCGLMLRDSAHIQESDVRWKNRKAQRAGEAMVEPLYTVQDAEGTLRLFQGCEYGRQYPVAEDMVLRFTDVGHLLGSACVELWLTENGQTKKIVFSGDVGNRNHPLIRDPQTVEEADYVVLESTYGDRSHTESGHTTEQLAEVLNRTFARGGNVVIPSFAVGRTQEMLYALREIKQRKLVPSCPSFSVYVDSPMATEATSVFLQCDTAYFDNETKELLKQGINPIWFDGIRLSVTSDDSKQINEDKTPKVILSASGMCDAGRIRHHLKHNLWRDDSTILFVGYQSQGTLGRRLLEGATEVTLFGEPVSVKAEITSLHGVSGHADREGLIAWLRAFAGKPIVFLNHGDERACEALAQQLHEQYGYTTVAPYSGTEYDLLSGQVTVPTQGVRIRPREKSGHTRSREIYRALCEAANELLHLVRQSEHRPNKELSKFTDQIRNLIQKWR